jgi:hypothetical protein
MELVMSKERVTSPLSHHFLRKISFTICFSLNLSLWLPLIILIVFSLFSILISNCFVKKLTESLKIKDSSIWLFINNKILILVPFKRKLVILVIHKSFYVVAPLKMRLVFCKILTPVPIKMRLVKPLSSGT